MEDIVIPMWLQIALLVGSVLGALATIIKTIRLLRKWGREVRGGLESAANIFNFLREEYSPNGGKSHKDLLIISTEKQDTIIGLMSQILYKLNSGQVQINSKNEEHDEPS